MKISGEQEELLNWCSNMEKYWKDDPEFRKFVRILQTYKIPVKIIRKLMFETVDNGLKILEDNGYGYGFNYIWRDFLIRKKYA